jgi:hypothetical protein
MKIAKSRDISASLAHHPAPKKLGETVSDSLLRAAYREIHGDVLQAGDQASQQLATIQRNASSAPDGKALLVEIFTKIGRKHHVCNERSYVHLPLVAGRPGPYSSTGPQSHRGNSPFPHRPRPAKSPLRATGVPRSANPRATRCLFPSAPADTRLRRRLRIAAAPRCEGLCAEEAP